MFVLSKIWAFVSDPTLVAVVLLLAGTALLFTRLWRVGRVMLAGLAVALAAVSVLPMDSVLITPLEDRFPPPSPMPEKVDGIVVLGGSFNASLSAARGQTAANGAVERVTALVGLARRYPDARIIFTGGSGSVTEPSLREAPVAKAFLDGLGFDTARMVFEPDSRNTRENAVLGLGLMRPGADETWLLVTTAMHMPRALGTFRAAGWPVTAYPVDYLTTGRTSMPGFDPESGLNWLSAGLHEWQGLAYYRLRGWTEALFPAPL